MTEKANPSVTRPAEAFKTAGAIAYGGHGGSGFVVDGASPTENSVQDGSITEANLNAFAETSGGASLDVTIDAGEAFVYGSWLAIDTQTTVTLAASTAGQTVYVGWNKDGTDDVIVGLASAFSSASGDADQKIPLWDFDTDGSGVTATTDRRRIGYSQEITGTQYFGANNEVSVSYDNSNSELSVSGDLKADNFNTGGDTYSRLFNDGTAFRTSGWDSGDEIKLRVRGASSSTGGVQVQWHDNSAGTDTTIFEAVNDGSINIPEGNLNLSGGFITLDPNNAIISGQNVGGGGGSDYYWRMQTGIALDVYNTNEAESYFTVNENGPVTISNATFGLPQFTSDPSASAGEMWYRSDLD
ncbi:hypothetical protein M199_gp029 [Halogranum tailed virus 1]|uniref:Uncharacterized protein n=1 Tax=Halogranum tailed virus 1 TaxID=1273749 RepID=R4T6N2_9CAUD|nr:hypothetical protein M199_gp029 [Halogranum tailed virus 1]AGM11359.1 hypothetical protein HGTV1_29 [Halogranum tailed virus 1]